MTNLVRVRDTITGANYTIPNSALDTDRHQVIDEPALDSNGDPRAATYPKPEAPKAPAEAPKPDANKKEAK